MMTAGMMTAGIRADRAAEASVDPAQRRQVPSQKRQSAVRAGGALVGAAGDMPTWQLDVVGADR
ncbi:hypothetical protein DM194_27575 (plasmid) [Azospirillum ramasamyi]|uniref:Uncharacterized protein n=1 Tax=Azospirillum ramasamyi TaxID=682998 RepID=A0A2U9SF61_9PROT|nr:hypothetical protein DM194_27575 [Azospirillum ramasamyi]